MNHTKENKKILNKMSEQEKLDRTTAEAFDKRGMLIFYQHGHYITKSDYPYKDSKKHYILRINYFENKIFEIIKGWQFDGYTIIRNQPNKQSVKREHIHLIKF